MSNQAKEEGQISFTEFCERLDSLPEAHELRQIPFVDLISDSTLIRKVISATQGNLK